MAAMTVEALTKDFGPVRAVDDLSFDVEPGTVTGFLGPNGSGKSTTLRALLGLVTPTRGRALIEGRAYTELRDPSRHVGAVLDAGGFHPGRSARNHLRALARETRIPSIRADEALELVGLTDAARRRAGGFSLGMRQRLALAGALLGDPRILVLDEPANGLDPEGIRWLRRFLRHLAAEGRTVLVSSHGLAEIEQTVDHVVIIARGRLVRQAAIAELAEQGGHRVVVRTPQAGALAELLQRDGLRIDPGRESDSLTVFGATPEVVGSRAAAAGIVLYGISDETRRLEDIFFDLTTAKEAVS